MTFLRPSLAALTLAALCLPAQAAWTELGGNEQVTFYADFDALEKNKEGVAIWTLVDARKPRSYEGKSFSSVRTQFEFHCEGPKVREIETRFHAGAMAGGDMVASYKVGEPAWEAVGAGTVKDALAQELCKKAKPAP